MTRIQAAVLSLLFFGLFVLGVLDRKACAASWDSSPNNWENSSSNWSNSSSRWENSSSNWENSPNRWGNDRTIYESDGEAVGYAVPQADGGTNLYGLDGDREGFTP